MSRQRQTFATCLRDEHAVERVAVDEGKAPRDNRMLGGDRKLTETAGHDLLWKVGRERQFADRLLDRDLANRDRADIDTGFLVKPSLYLARESRVIGQPPQH